MTMEIETSFQMIKKYDPLMKRPVKLVLFTADTGCVLCPEARTLSGAIKDHFSRIALETYDLVMDRDKSQLYGITQVPALVVEGEGGHTVTFTGLPKGSVLAVLLNTIHAVSYSVSSFPESIRQPLRHLANDVMLRVFVRSDCPECRPVAELAIGLALEQEQGLVHSEIIIAGDFPSLVKKYDLRVLPHAIFGENLHVEGHLSESEFLELLFQAEGIQKGPDRRCLVCGMSSQDVICQNCKARIRAEAVDHKLRSERLKTKETS